MAFGQYAFARGYFGGCLNTPRIFFLHIPMLLYSLDIMPMLIPAIEAFAPQMGYSPRVVRAGFDTMFSHWTRDEFLAFVMQEIPGFRAENLDDFLDIGVSCEQRAQMIDRACVRRLLMVTASTVPSAAFQDVMLTLLLPVQIEHRPSRAHAGFFKAVHEQISSCAPQLASRWHLVDSAHDDAVLLQTMRACDAVNISASRQTIEHFRGLKQQLPEAEQPAIWIEHGHKISAIVLHSDEVAALTREDFDAMAWDASIWDQTGCLSPKCVYLQCGEEQACAFAQQLLTSLDDVALELPEMPPDMAELAQRNSALIMAELGGATVFRGHVNRDVIVVHGPQGTAGNLEPPILLPRILNVYPVDSMEPAARHLVPFGQALASKNDLTSEDKKLFSNAGFHRFTHLGQMQNPPLTWFHDNIGTLRPLIG